MPTLSPAIAALLLAALSLVPSRTAAAPREEIENSRPPASQEALRFWLEDMVAFHRFSLPEVESATGLSPTAIQSALRQFGIQSGVWPDAIDRDRLVVLPYPGGRHPRIGFLEGAIRPQRETKVSVFTPWDPASYVVLDVPEAIWSNLGLTYLAHTHIPTIWDKAGTRLRRLEWQRREDGDWVSERALPNGIVFGTRIAPKADSLRMEMWLKNGTKETLTGLRVQNCVLFKGARGFRRQTNENKVVRRPYVACRSESGGQWIITAWDPCHRAWSNASCPCMHSDPQFPDCAPGGTVRVRGWFSFYQGIDPGAEFDRIERTGWRKAP